MRGLFLVYSLCVLAVRCMVEGVREISGVTFIRMLIPFMGAAPSLPQHCPKAAPPNTITPGIRISAQEFGEDTNTHAMAPGSPACRDHGTSWLP